MARRSSASGTGVCFIRRSSSTHRLDDFADRFVGAAGVDGDVAGVAIRAEAAEHRVGQPALLADVLEQPRAHRPAEHRVQDVADVAVVVVLRIAVGAETDVALLELLGPDDAPAARRAARVVRDAAARRAAACSKAPADQVAHLRVLDVAGRRDDQVRRAYSVAEIVAQRSLA